MGGHLASFMEVHSRLDAISSESSLPQDQQHQQRNILQALNVEDKTKNTLIKYCDSSSNTKCRVKPVAPRGNLIKIASNQY